MLNESQMFQIKLILSHRFPLSEETPMDVSGAVSEALKSALPSPARPVSLSVCQENLCRNGGTCHPINLPDGVNSFQCDCRLHFTGRFCEKGNCASHFSAERGIFSWLCYHPSLECVEKVHWHLRQYGCVESPPDLDQ